MEATRTCRPRKDFEKLGDLALRLIAGGKWSVLLSDGQSLMHIKVDNTLQIK